MEELRQMDQRIRKFMTMHNALHRIDVKDKLYVLRKGGRRLANFDDSLDASIREHKDYIKKNKERDSA